MQYNKGSPLDATGDCHYDDAQSEDLTEAPQASGGTEATVTMGASLFDAINLPAPVNIGYNRYVTSSKISYYFQPGETPTMYLGGTAMQTSNSDTASIIGYLVPVK